MFRGESERRKHVSEKVVDIRTIRYQGFGANTPEATARRHRALDRSPEGWKTVNAAKESKRK